MDHGCHQLDATFPRTKLLTLLRIGGITDPHVAGLQLLWGCMSTRFAMLNPAGPNPLTDRPGHLASAVYDRLRRTSKAPRTGSGTKIMFNATGS